MSRPSILITDDDQDMQLMLERWFTREEYEVNCASSGLECIEILKKIKPDVILLDYMMPGTNGKETLKIIRENPETKSIPVFFLTGNEDAEDDESLKALSPNGFLQKSLGKKPIVSAINEFIRGL